MAPTLISGDVIILDSSSNEIAREDLVVFNNPQEWHEIWLGPDNNRFIISAEKTQ